MSEQQKTIDALWPVAHAAASHIAEWHTWDKGGANHQQFGDPANGGWDGSRYIAGAFAEPGVVEYRLRGGADVRITGIEVAGVRPEDVEVGPIEPTGPQRVVRAQVIPNRNTTPRDVPWELQYRDLQAETAAATVAKEVGASIAAGMRQQVGYGSEAYGITGETELTLNIEASVKAAWEDTFTSHREHEVESKRDIVIPAMSETVLERVETVGPARQVIRARGALKFGIRLHAPGHFVHSWDSMADFSAALQGIETKSGSQWLGFYQRWPVPSAKLEPFRGTIYSEIERVREFEEASNVRVDIRSIPLDDAARLREALYVVAQGAADETLRSLAAAEAGA